MARLIHYAAKVRANDGAASALCFKRPRAIRLSAGVGWTISPEAVTCSKCLGLLLKGMVPHGNQQAPQADDDRDRVEAQTIPAEAG